MADGSEHSSERYIIHEMRVGNHAVKDVVANIVPTKGDALLGQSFLKELPSWAIDNDRHELVLQEHRGGSQQKFGDINPKYSVLFVGKCRYQLAQGFFPCDDKVFWNALKNGRMLLSFITNTMLFHVSGGTDRQPNLENYYIDIDTFTMQKMPSREEVTDRNFEGQCHFRLNKEATKFFDIRCDVYNRRKSFEVNLYLERIRSFERKDF